VTLTGGTVSLTDSDFNLVVSSSDETTAAATLTNSDTIIGAGTIGDANLTLLNYGDIAASGTHELVLNTGGNTITNEATRTLEAKNGGTREIDSTRSNLALATDAAGGTVELVADTVSGGTIALNGGATLATASTLQIEGAVTLTGGTVSLTDSDFNLVVSSSDETTAAATLTNSDTIIGAGTIGDSHLTLLNYGDIAASGTHELVLNTGG